MFKFEAQLDPQMKALVARTTNKQIEEEFGKLQDDFAKIDYAEKLLKKHGVLEKYQNTTLIAKSPKDNEKSEEFRYFGNEYYTQGKYKEALVQYNRR